MTSSLPSLYSPRPLCPPQDGDLKYMVAFNNAAAAVEWSLLMQDVMLYADWPEVRAAGRGRV